MTSRLHGIDSRIEPFLNRPTMTTLTTARKWRDTVTIPLLETDLGGSDLIDIYDRPVPNGYTYSLFVYPPYELGDLNVFVSFPAHRPRALLDSDEYPPDQRTILRKYKLTIEGSSIEHTESGGFHKPIERDVSNLLSFADLRPWFRNGQIVIKCELEFDVLVPFAPSALAIAQYCDHVSTDFDFVVGTDRIPVHKSFLALLSPVFHAMLTHDTLESRFGQVEITDFDVETVKAAIDYCYGREFEDLSVEKCIDVYRFADKYDIKAVTTQLEDIPFYNLTLDNFCIITNFAFQYSKDALFDECAKLFKKNQGSFEYLSDITPLCFTALYRAAVEEDALFNALRFAAGKGWNDAVNELETPANLSIDVISDAVAYAWTCSRNDFKKACATFVYQNKEKVMKYNNFDALPNEVVHNVLTLGNDLWHSLSFLY